MTISSTRGEDGDVRRLVVVGSAANLPAGLAILLGALISLGIIVAAPGAGRIATLKWWT